MNELYLLYSLWLFILLGLTLLGLANNFRFRRGIMVVLFLSLIGISYHGLVDFFGQPRPIKYSGIFGQIHDVDKANVLGFKIDDGKAIYVLLIWDGQSVPLYVAYPWNQNMAQQLQDAQQQAQESGNGRGLVMSHPFGTSMWAPKQDSMQVYPEPVPQQLQPKEVPQVGPIEVPQN